MPLPRVQGRLDLPVARNPWPYMTPGGPATMPDLKPPPSNFSDQGVRRAELAVPRPASRPNAHPPAPPAFPGKLTGVAPADQVPVKEVGTRPNSAVRAFISNRSGGAILYQGSMPVKNPRYARY